MEYDAVTFDTQTVRTNSFNFNSGLLNELKKLRHDRFQVIVSDIIRSEILKQLSEYTQQVTSQLDTAIKKANELGIASINKPQKVDSRHVATSQLRKYFVSLGALVVLVDEISASDLMKQYFAGLPPFASKGEKKVEFPDAAALLSIEAWAKKAGFRVLAISGDGDWKRFGEVSGWIDVVPDISIALDLLKGQSDKARVVAGEVLSRITQNDVELFRMLEKQLETAVSRLSVSADARSYHRFETEYVGLEFVSFALQNIDGFELLDANDTVTELTIAVEAQLTVEASASFYISLYDGIDRDYVPMGTTEVAKTTDIDVQLLIKVSRDDEAVEIWDVEITKAPSEIDFGEIEPDFRNEYYDEPDEELEAISADEANEEAKDI